MHIRGRLFGESGRIGTRRRFSGWGILSPGKRRISPGFANADSMLRTISMWEPRKFGFVREDLRPGPRIIKYGNRFSMLKRERTVSTSGFAETIVTIQPGLVLTYQSCLFGYELKLMLPQVNDRGINGANTARYMGGKKKTDWPNP